MRKSALLFAVAMVLSATAHAEKEKMASEKSFDVNKDGFIDKEEAGEAVEAFGDFDKDSDGKLTLEQFQEAMSKRKLDGADTPGDTTLKTPDDKKGEPADVPPKAQPAKPGSEPTK
ncbi:MAG: hypothetical protein CMN28_14285 [Salinisphaeraceae bacterium]|nr:hypothetical protein [Salinisphaeraceae bacterium]